MKYSDVKATELQDKFQIPNVTVRVWKARNNIPDKYKKEQLPLKITGTNELQQIQNMVRAFKTGKFKRLPLC